MHNEGMTVPPLPAQRLHFPAALVLGALTLWVWTAQLGGTRSGVSVVNHSGLILRNVEVCLTSGECAVRGALWPHDAWQVPVPHQADVVKVRYHRAGAVIRTGEGRQTQIVVQPNGQLRLARQEE